VLSFLINCIVVKSYLGWQLTRDVDAIHIWLWHDFCSDSRFKNQNFNSDTRHRLAAL